MCSPAAGAAQRAPKKVPAERMETTSDSEDEEIAYPVTCLGSVEGKPNCLSHDFISLIPLITPVSYPKRIPPNALKAVVMGIMSKAFESMQNRISHWSWRYQQMYSKECQWRVTKGIERN